MKTGPSPPRAWLDPVAVWELLDLLDISQITGTVSRSASLDASADCGLTTKDRNSKRCMNATAARMHVVSANSAGRTIVHFEASAADQLYAEMRAFLDWFDRRELEPDLQKDAAAHLCFVTIHPCDDGNGRIARAITDLALARSDGTDTRLYSMSAEIMRQRSRYYRALEVTQSGSMNITGWMLWFLDCLTDAMIEG